MIIKKIGNTFFSPLSQGDGFYRKLISDFTGPQSGEGLELETTPCKNRVLIQIGLLREDHFLSWDVVLNWLKAIFPKHNTAHFRRLIERGITTTMSLGIEARRTFLDSDVNFDFVGPICDSIGVEREHLLKMKDFSERAQSVEVTNGLILELSNFIAREQLAPIVIVSWLRNFNPEFCSTGNIKQGYKNLKSRLKMLKKYSCRYETKSQRRNATMENFLQSPFELVQKREIKRRKKDVTNNNRQVKIMGEYESFEIMKVDGSESRGVIRKTVVKKEMILCSEDEDEEEEPSYVTKTPEDKVEGLTLLDITTLSVQKLSSVYGGKTAACKQMSEDLLQNQYSLMCVEHPDMAMFKDKVSSVSGELSMAPPVAFLNMNAHFLVDVHDAIEQHIMNFEKDVMLSTGNKLGRDNLPKFKNFVNMEESATSRYIHMVCDIICPERSDFHNYRNHWVAFCEEKRNPSRLVVNESNRFINYFEVAAGLIHHHKEIALFFSDLIALDTNKCLNVILESVAADANDSVIQSLVCVLAIIHCKILGPYWQLMKSETEYSLFPKYLLGLYQKFLDWSKESVALLEPEELLNVFLLHPLQEKTYSGVFVYCGQWHTNRDMIRACLKRAIKVIAAVTEKHLKDFLPGGRFSQVPSPDVSRQLASCTFSVLMTEYPLRHEHGCKFLKCSPDENSTYDSSLEDDVKPSLGSSEDLFGLQDRKIPNTIQKDGESDKKSKVKMYKELFEEEIDTDYVIATVHRNGGPCLTKQDLDKMTLRFDGKSKEEKRDGYRCEILYQKLILNNTSEHLNCVFHSNTHMMNKLSLALPRVKPGYSIVLAPRKTFKKPLHQMSYKTAAEKIQSSSAEEV